MKSLPLVLRTRERVPLPAEDASTYDLARDMWVFDGTPLVELGEVGRTLLTATSEGLDQSEGTESALTRERLKTMITLTAEGVDQAGEGVEASLWGRTTVTKSMEGVDASEATEVGHWGRTAQTRSCEGIDAVETVELRDSQCS
ncbi:MAG: hypothetical protein U1E22_06575, partial [Coriobacteriia bacterium]|nr:hypothetical protein [Coriobacteriia bacterium]